MCIRQRERVVLGHLIVNDGEAQFDHLTDNEAEFSNCFSINQSRQTKFCLKIVIYLTIYNRKIQQNLF